MSINILIIVITGIFGFFLDSSLFQTAPALNTPLIRGLLFSVLSAIAILLFYLIKRIEKRKLLFFVFGILAGTLSASFLLFILPLFFGVLPVYLTPLIFAFFIAVFIKYFINLELNTNTFSMGNISHLSKKHNMDAGHFKILDTSVIIDGRISDIVETGFIDGILVVPQFVLMELQQIADSAEAIKRSRGRRGLDILNKMKLSDSCVIKISDTDFPDVQEVDNKLIELTRVMKGVVVTNDFNLNKVAELKGIKVLNINALSNALKPSVLPGEEMLVTILKEGKDPDQGIAYLDDGTMIVVDHGKSYINQKINVVVTSVFQTPAGRMIFTQPQKEA